MKIFPGQLGFQKVPPQQAGATRFGAALQPSQPQGDVFVRRNPAANTPSEPGKVRFGGARQSQAALVEVLRQEKEAVAHAVMRQPIPILSYVSQHALPTSLEDRAEWFARSLPFESEVEPVDNPFTGRDLLNILVSPTYVSDNDLPNMETVEGLGNRRVRGLGKTLEEVINAIPRDRIPSYYNDATIHLITKEALHTAKRQGLAYELTSPDLDFSVHGVTREVREVLNLGPYQSQETQAVVPEKSGENIAVTQLAKAMQSFFNAVAPEFESPINKNDFEKAEFLDYVAALGMSLKKAPQDELRDPALVPDALRTYAKTRMIEDESLHSSLLTLTEFVQDVLPDHPLASQVQALCDQAINANILEPNEIA